MKAAIRLICATGIIALSVTNVAARNDFKASGFSANVQDFHGMTLAFCRKHGASVLNTSEIFGTLEDAENFRRACGSGLNGIEIAYTPWRHFYWRNANAEGVRDVMGVVQELDQEGRTFRLVIGLETRISRPHNKPEVSRQLANATLFQQQGSDWFPVWRFIDPVTGKFHLPDSGGEAAFVNSVWRRQVTTGFGRLLRSLEDARGPGFPN